MQPKLTPELQKQIVKTILAGNYGEVASEAAGIDRATFYRWMERGQKSGKADKPYREFRSAVEEARADSETELVATIMKAAASGSWPAAAWLLERGVSPERWAKLTERKRANSDEVEEPKSAAEAIRDEVAAKRKARATGT